MREGNVQSAITSHRNARDRALVTSGADSIMLFHGRHELLYEEVLVGAASVARVDVEGGVAVGSDDDELADAARVTQLLQHGPAARVDKRLAVAAEPVQPVQNGIFARGFLIKARR